jgi:hypothetical protein
MKKIKFAHAPFLVASGLLALELAASAATYTFIFNNTEQGDNSTANPGLSVAADGTVTKTGVVAAPAKPVVNSSSQGLVQTPVADAPVSSLAASATQPVATPEFRHFRLIGSAAVYQARLQESSGPKWTGSLAYFYNHEWGLNVFGVIDTDAADNEVQAGAELELVPIRISLGRIENLVEIAILGGASHAQDWTEPHIGARVNLNLGESWGLTATGRYARDYAMAEAGLALHL